MTVTTPPGQSSRPARKYRGTGLRKNNQRRKGVNRMAIASVITGVLLFPLPFIALCLGGSALGTIRRHPRQTGKSLAILGMVLGGIGVAAWVALFVAVLLYRDSNLIPGLN